MQGKLAIDNTDMHPTMTWCHNNFLCLSFPTPNILWNPWRYEVRAQLRFFFYLFNNMLPLVKRCALCSGEVMKCGAVRTLAVVPCFKSALHDFPTTKGTTFNQWKHI